MPAESTEYEEFIREEMLYRRLSVYENLCKISERILPFGPWESLRKKYENAINFSHMKITPKGAFSLAVLVAVLIFLIPLFVMFVLNSFSISVMLFTSTFSLMSFIYLYNFPMHYSTVFRIKASAEMVLAIIYMSISMKISHNLESAVKFAAKNLKGPLSYDLRKVLWDVYTRRYDTIGEALDAFLLKWERENQEFTEAVSMIKTAVLDAPSRVDKTLDEAVSIMLTGTKERMRHYAQELRTPVNILNSMGILLPLIGLVFFPIIGMFLPDVIKPVFIAAGYDVFLPVVVYWMMNSYLEKRPYTFHQPDLSKHPKFSKERLFGKVLFFSWLVSLILIVISLSKLLFSSEPFSFELLGFSLLLTWGISSGLILYTILSTWNKLKIRGEVVQIESEFAEALLQLGNQLGRGIPFETALENLIPKIKDMKISKFFADILYNVETFGMTLEQAIFDKQYGALRMYPSTLIEAIMHAITEISKKGMVVVSNSMVSIATYLKDVHSVEEDLRDMLSEVTSTMQIQAWLLAPLTAGIVVALTSAVMKLMVAFTDAVSKIQNSLMASGPAGAVGNTALGSMINVNSMMPVHWFQLIVGVYMVEIVSMLSVFISQINNGEENILRKYNLGVTLLVATLMYTVLVIAIYLALDSLMPPIVGLV
jgi:hypothetical protein